MAGQVGRITVKGADWHVNSAGPSHRG